MESLEKELIKNSARRYCGEYLFGQIAQMVEQRTENPCVAGSIPVLANFFYSKKMGRKKVNCLTFVWNRSEALCLARTGGRVPDSSSGHSF